LTGGGITNVETAQKYGRKGTEGISGCGWDVKLDLSEFWTQVKRLCKDEHTPVLMFCNTKFGFDLYSSNPKWFRYDLVWDKERGVSFLLANKMPMKSHEMIYVFSKAGAHYNRVDISGNFAAFPAHNHPAQTRTAETYSGRNVAKGSDGTTRCPLSVIRLRKPNTLGHPTEKPKELYEWLLRRYVPTGGTVLDPTAGSFNSVTVAKSLGYKAIGIEKDRGFFYKAIADEARIC
jgi:site-specific DNA-methyltransferase (adenine-specific)